MLIEITIRNHGKRQKLLYNTNCIRSIKPVTEMGESCGSWITTINNELFPIVEEYKDIKKKILKEKE